MKITTKVFNILFFSLVALYLGYVAYQHISVNRQLAKQKDLIDRHLNQFREDQEFADRLDFFKPTTRERNAGEYLNSRIEWHRLEGHPYVYTNSQHPIVYPRDQSWSAYDELEMFDHAEDVWKSSVDTTWMHDLLLYDYWDWYTNSPQEYYINQNPTLGPWFAPWPSVIGLKPNWAAIRLIQGLKRNDVDQAIREVQHVAKLLYSANVPITSYASVAYLKQIAEFVQRFKIRTSISVLSTDDVARLRRLLPARYSMMIYPWKESDIAEINGGFAYCSALADRMSIASYFGPLLDGGLAKYREVTNQMISEHPECTLAINKKIWNDPSFEKFYDTEDCGHMMDIPACKSINQVAKMPFLGSLLAKTTLANLLSKNNWEGYQAN